MTNCNCTDSPLGYCTEARRLERERDKAWKSGDYTTYALAAKAFLDHYRRNA